MAFGTERKPGQGDYESPSQSFFGRTMRIEGEITSDEDLTIEGKVKGQLQVSKTLTIGKEGYVEGKITANVVHISGEAEGHLAASEKLVVSSEGKYTGNIKSDTVKVAEGAKIKGTINLEEEKITQPQPDTKDAGKKTDAAETTGQSKEKKAPPQQVVESKEPETKEPESREPETREPADKEVKTKELDSKELAANKPA